MAGLFRIDVLRKELPKLGYTYTAHQWGGVSYTRFVSPAGRVWLYKDHKGMFPFPYVSAANITYYKDASREFFAQYGYSVINHVVYQEGLCVETYRAKLGLPQDALLVVKPVDADASRGLTMGVRTNADLQEAIRTAKRHSDTVIIQRYVEGEEIRFAVIDGVVSTALHKEKPRVVGDGILSIAQLVEKENDARRALSLEYVQYPLLEHERFMQGIDGSRIPHRGERVLLADSVALEDGASFYNRTDEVHPSYIELAAAMANQLGRGYIAIDLLIQDFTRQAVTDSYAFLEVNDLPGMQLFYETRDNKEITVGGDLARYIDKVLHV